MYNLIRDIDDDGNGALDIHEFHLLLNRVGCDFLGEAKKRKGGHH